MRLLAVVMIALYLAALTLVVVATVAEDARPSPGLPPEPPPAPPAEMTLALQLEVLKWRRRARYLGRRVRVQHRELLKQRRLFRRARLTDPLGRHPLELAFLCVHQGEGRWSANTGNGYFGGLQMDRRFQLTYGPEFVRAFGTADRWPRSVQIAVAVRGWLDRGFQPWPNTARRCGLL